MRELLNLTTQKQYEKQIKVCEKFKDLDNISTTLFDKEATKL